MGIINRYGYCMKNVVIMGGAGFIGRVVSNLMLNEGWNVIVVTRDVNKKKLDRRIKYFSNSSESFRELKLLEVDVVINLAVAYGRRDETIIDVIETNILLSLRALELVKYKPEALYLSFDSFAEQNKSKKPYMWDYLLSKRQANEWLIQTKSKCKIILVRLHHVYGERDGSGKFIPWFIKQLEESVGEINLSGGEQERDFIYVEDVARGINKIIDSAHDIEDLSIIEIGSGHLYKLREFLTILTDYWCLKNKTKKPNLNFGALPYNDSDLMFVTSDTSRLKKIGFECRYSLNQGIEKMVNQIHFENSQ